MKRGVLLLCAAVAPARSGADAVNPIEKVMEMLSSLQAKIIRQGEDDQKVYSEFAEWCEDRSREIHFEIKTAKGDMGNLEAAIEEATDDEAAAGVTIEELSGAISTDEADLKASGLIREKESNAFAQEEKSLLDATDTIERAVTILEKEAQGGAAFAQVQVKSAQDLVKALSALVDASALSYEDTSKLTALVQTDSDSDDGDDDDDMDAAPEEKEKSASIVDTLESLLEKSQSKLEEMRKDESGNKHNYELFKQSLETKLAFAKQEMDSAKKKKAEAGEKKATAQGDLAVTKKDVAEDLESLSELHHDCMEKATSFQDVVKSRAEELKALATAKKIIAEATGGDSQLQVAGQDQASDMSYGESQQEDREDRMSFVQLRATSSSDNDSTDIQAARYVRKFARKVKSGILMQLASKLDSAIRSEDDPFAKVKGLVGDMLAKLMKAAEADATHKAYCDKEMSHTETKLDDKSDEIEKLSTKIDQQSAESAKLKEEVAVLSNELAEIAKAQAETDNVRAEEKALFDKDKPELEKGLEGVQKALKVLRDYYAKGDDASHGASSGGASGIIGMLEVVESDFSKGISEMVSGEQGAIREYEALSKENAIAKATKEDDVRFKTKAAKSLDKASADMSSDRDGVQEELDAVNEYYSKIKESCVAKAEPFEERKKRREQEIAGLKDAQDILDRSDSFLQEASSTNKLRGIQRHL